ncbi:hypothetical protein RRG08_029507, partial [Elysia crispata]
NYYHNYHVTLVLCPMCLVLSENSIYPKKKKETVFKMASRSQQSSVSKQLTDLDLPWLAGVSGSPPSRVGGLGRCFAMMHERGERCVGGTDQMKQFAAPKLMFGHSG